MAWAVCKHTRQKGVVLSVSGIPITLNKCATRLLWGDQTRKKLCFNLDYLGVHTIQFLNSRHTPRHIHSGPLVTDCFWGHILHVGPCNNHLGFQTHTICPPWVARLHARMNVDELKPTSEKFRQCFWKMPQFCKIEGIVLIIKAYYTQAKNLPWRLKKELRVRRPLMIWWGGGIERDGYRGSEFRLRVSNPPFPAYSF